MDTTLLTFESIFEQRGASSPLKGARSGGPERMSNLRYVAVSVGSKARARARRAALGRRRRRLAASSPAFSRALRPHAQPRALTSPVLSPPSRAQVAIDYTQPGGGGEREDFAGTLRTIFASPGWDAARAGAKAKLELTSGASTYCLEFDGPERERVLVAVVRSGYPTRYVFSSSAGAAASPRLFRELRDAVEGAVAGAEGAGAQERALKRALKPALKGLAAKFDALDALDALLATTKKVADVQRAMAANMALAAGERDALLSTLGDKAETLSASGRAMFEGAKSIKSAARWRCVKIYAVAATLVLAVATAIVVSLNYSTYHWWS